MSDVDNKVKMIVEGLLLAAGRPLTLDNIITVFSKDEKPDRKELKTVMEKIAEECNDRGFELKEVASGYRFQVKQELSEWVAKLWEERPPRYTRALLETLSLIAYRQPITRGDIEEIRGVGVSSNIIRTLMDREWVRIVGHRDVPGRPALFATTKPFLDYFNLKSLQELPPLSEIKELDGAGEELNSNEELVNQRVLEIPEDATDEGSYELSAEEAAEMLAEEEAIELSKKPLDEILALDPARLQEQMLEEEFADEAQQAPGSVEASDLNPEQSESDEASVNLSEDAAGAELGESLADEMSTDVSEEQQPAEDEPTVDDDDFNIEDLTADLDEEGNFLVDDGDGDDKEDEIEFVITDDTQEPER